MILDKIVTSTKKRIAETKQLIPEAEMGQEALRLPRGEGFPFAEALQRKEISIIAELKKASPSKGILTKDFPYLYIAQEYEAGGAAAISVLTEPDFFQGNTKYLTEVKQVVSLPVLRKDFIIDAYQLYETKRIGADAVLLICSILSKGQLQEYILLCDTLGLSALVEVRSKQEIELALQAGATIIGVNNRDLKTFTINIETAILLRSYVPPKVLFVAESGIQTPEDMLQLQGIDINGVLIGETLMRSKNKKKMLEDLRGIKNES